MRRGCVGRRWTPLAPTSFRCRTACAGCSCPSRGRRSCSRPAPRPYPAHRRCWISRSAGRGFRAGTANRPCCARRSALHRHPCRRSAPAGYRHPGSNRVRRRRSICRNAMGRCRCCRPGSRLHVRCCRLPARSPVARRQRRPPVCRSARWSRPVRWHSPSCRVRRSFPARARTGWCRPKRPAPKARFAGL
ncbi:hypothetical protein D3C75_713140 [compost metagenome]